MFLFSSSVHAEEANHPEWAPELLGRVTKRIGSVIVGHEEQISLTMIALLAGGHVAGGCARSREDHAGEVGGLVNWSRFQPHSVYV